MCTEKVTSITYKYNAYSTYCTTSIAHRTVTGSRKERRLRSWPPRRLLRSNRRRCLTEPQQHRVSPPRFIGRRPPSPRIQQCTEQYSSTEPQNTTGNNVANKLKKITMKFREFSRILHSLVFVYNIKKIFCSQNGPY